MRTDPKSFVKVFEKYAKQIDGLRWKREGKPTLIMNEGLPAIYDAINFLKK